MKAEAREIFTAEIESTHLYGESGAIKSISQGNIIGTGVRVIRDGKQGFASSLGKVELYSLIKSARGIAETSPPDPYVAISEGGIYFSVDGIYDKKIDTLNHINAVRETAEETLSLVRETDSRFSIDSFMVDIDTSHVYIENTNGVDVEERRTTFSLSISGMAIEGEEVSSFDYITIEDVAYDRFRERARKKVKEFVNRMVKTLHPKKVRSHKGLLLLSPRAVEDILIDFIIYHASGLRVLRGGSMWKDAMEKTVASDKLSIIDNPLVDGTLYATSFDREGTPTSITPIMEKGILKNFFLNTYSANALGMENTAHASGSYSSIPGIAPHCLKIDGTKHLQEMLKEIKGAVLLERFSGNINYQNGMVSGVAKNSFYIQDGEISYGIADTMVSFSIPEVLKNIIDISHETDLLGVGPMPYILIEGAEIIGG